MYNYDDVLTSLQVFDTDGDGRLHVKELEKAMMDFGMKKDESEGNGTTKMTGDEFTFMLIALKREDIIIDGYINIEQLASLFTESSHLLDH